LVIYRSLPKSDFGNVTATSLLVTTIPLETAGAEGTLSLTAPKVTITGNNPASVELGATYSDLGATATTVGDTGVSVELTVHTFLNGVETENISLNTATSATYTITYKATSQAGVVATAERIVIVGNNDGNIEALNPKSETITNDQSTNDTNTLLENATSTPAVVEETVATSQPEADPSPSSGVEPLAETTTPAVVEDPVATTTTPVVIIETTATSIATTTNQ